MICMGEEIGRLLFGQRMQSLGLTGGLSRMRRRLRSCRSVNLGVAVGDGGRRG